MINVSACKIFNEIDKEHFTMYVEWLNPDFKIILLKSKMTPLLGEMNTKDITYFSEELSKSSDEYLQETKEAFCGSGTDIRFFISDRTFEWRRKNILILGKITLCPISDNETLSESFLQLLNCHQSVQERLATLEIENQYLRDLKTKLRMDIEDMIKIKTTMEQDLYKRFLLILNGKKKQLQKLQNALKEKHLQKQIPDKIPGKSIFDMSTDENETSDEESTSKRNNFINSKKLDKRKSNGKANYGSAQKARKTNCNIEECEIGEPADPKASTSRASIAEPNDHVKSNDESIANRADLSKQESNSKILRFSDHSMFFLEESDGELFSD